VFIACYVASLPYRLIARALAIASHGEDFPGQFVLTIAIGGAAFVAADAIVYRWVKGRPHTDGRRPGVS
jgi:hypothetical protein